MQLTSKQSIASALALASCSLLSQQASAAEPIPATDDWKVDAAIMYYGEQDRQFNRCISFWCSGPK